jgi:hypothetical protein
MSSWWCIVEWHSDSEQTRVERYVLVADTGGLPPLALRPRLTRLAQMQLKTGRPAPVVAIATTSQRRLEAWLAVLAGVANSPRGGFLESCIHAWDCWRTGRAAIPWTGQRESASQSAFSQIPKRIHAQYRPWSHVRRPIDLNWTRAAVVEWDISVGGRAALDVIGRHHFLPTSSLGDLLGSDRRRALTWRKELVRRGLVRVVARDEVPPNLTNRGDCLEATVPGLTMLAGSIGLSLAAAVQHHGFGGRWPDYSRRRPSGSPRKDGAHGWCRWSFRQDRSCCTYSARRSSTGVAQRGSMRMGPGASRRLRTAPTWAA